jgi:hypothetical protein
MSVVSLSKLVSLTSFTIGFGFSMQKSSIASKNVLAQSGLGNPKMPLDIAGIATDLHSSLSAVRSVLSTAECRRFIFFYGSMRSFQIGPTA